MRGGSDVAVTPSLGRPYPTRDNAHRRPVKDIMIAGSDVLTIRQADRRKSTNFVPRYLENGATRELHERRRERLRNIP